MIVNFNGNPQTSIIVCYSPTNVCDPTEIESFYENLTSTTTCGLQDKFQNTMF